MAFNERDWETILYGIESDECILPLGPELPIGAQGDVRQTAVDTLIARLRQSLGDNASAAKTAELPHVAQRYLADPSHGEIDLEREVKRWHQALVGQRAPIYD